ncbi:proteasome alpha6 subunit [Lycorma delicatula]|uniref:proteasome alpha6 subunit n=1 Tax=Lycorma delicatula TaxID=130591 RepID=UPI003F518CE0
MFRNQYDSDVTVWSPQGRLHQVEYAMEAVKLGSATVGLKNKTHALILALKRASSELSAHQKKMIFIDSHIGITISGLTADARMLSRFMRTECLNHKYAHNSLLPVSRLICTVGNKMQICTQRYNRRPYGVGLLVAGFDDQGPHIYQTCPSANYFDCKAMAVGSRSQSARTYLEKHLDEFPNCDTEELIKHGLRALRDTLPNDLELNTKNVAIGLVGEKTDFRVFEEEETGKYLAMIEGEEKRTPGGGTGGVAVESGSSESTQAASGAAGSSTAGEDPQDPQVAVAMETE